MIILKKIIIPLLIIVFLFSGCQPKKVDIKDIETITQIQTTAIAEVKEEEEKELRGIWISCYDIENSSKKSREEYKNIADDMFKRIAETGLDTAFIHMRAFADALYQSDIFPTSKYIAGERGARLDYDPFEVILESAEKHNISVHGWINPFRISYDNDPSLLCEDEISKKLIDENSTAVGILSSGIYFNPASTDAQKLILDGIKEILTKYDIDGIHIDDYFYPEDCEELDSSEFNAYASSGGTLEKADWRRATVDALVSAIYKTVKSFSPELIFSISPGARRDMNYDKLYADCEKWLSNEGYADWIIPQLYFGFEREKFDFNSLLEEWNSFERISSVKIACGLALYKVGTDESEEWANNNEVISAQIDAVRSKKWNGFVIFSYSDLLRSKASASVDKFKERIKVSQ